MNDLTLFFLRIGIGIIIMIHGYPKIMGGPQMWRYLGTTFMTPLHIHFLPMMWGFFAASAQFFGGIALIIGLDTRFAALTLLFSMCVAVHWHIHNKDDFTKYAYALTLIFIYSAFTIIGAGPFSIDYLLAQ